MGVPFRTFAESVTLMGIIVASKVSSAELGTLYNLAHREVVSSNQWRSREEETTITLIPPYTDGTVTVTQDSVTVTGAGTVWTADMVGRQFAASNINEFVTIATVTPPTTLTLASAWPFSTATAAGYRIMAQLYALPANCINTLLYATGHDTPLEQRSLSWLNYHDPTRILADTVPYVWVSHGVDPVTRQQLIEFYPRASAVNLIRIYYEQTVDDISGAALPLVRSDLIEARALYYASLSAHNKFGDPRWLQAANEQKDTYNVILDEEKREDIRRHGLPRSVQWQQNVRRGAYYGITHDVGWY